MADRYDAVLVGAGIMGATLAALLHELDPAMRLLMLERLDGPALESSAAANNAGTGHAANCELNYTPQQADGSVATAKALAINAAFERSLEFWATLRERGALDTPAFLNSVPHISFVWGQGDVAFLQQRHQQLSALPAFAGMEWSTDRSELAEWMPLVMQGRGASEPVAATRISRGTDVDFGSLTRLYLQDLQRSVPWSCARVVRSTTSRASPTAIGAFSSAAGSGCKPRLCFSVLAVGPCAAAALRHPRSQGFCWLPGERPMAGVR